MSVDAQTRAALEALLDRQSLDEDTAEALLRALANPELPPAFAGAVLAALRTKGVSAPELRGFARGMRALGRRPQIEEGSPTIDIVGTGGDKSGSVNLSTGSAILAAACGLRVVKHGNRSVSSRTGSADVLEALGLALPLDEVAAGKLLAASRFTFLFAPYYHPATKAIAQVRATLGVRTVFNILGPLTNPSSPDYHLIGAYSEEIAELIAQTLSGLPMRRAFVVHGAGGWDEPTPMGPFVLFDVTPGTVTRTVRDPRDAGIARCSAVDLAGDDATFNAKSLHAALCGETHGAVRDALTLGAGLALELVGEVPDLRAGIARAARAIDAGEARLVLEVMARLGGKGESA